MNRNDFFKGQDTFAELVERAKQYMPDNNYDYMKLDKTEVIVRMLYLIFLAVTAFAIDWYTLEKYKFLNESWTKYMRS